MDRHSTEGGPTGITQKTMLHKERQTETGDCFFSYCGKVRPHSLAQPNQEEVGTRDRLVYLSEKHCGDLFIDILGHIGTLSKERATSDPVFSSGTSAGLTSSKCRPLRQEARLCRSDSFSAEHS